MNVLELSRWQFGITTVYHFLFVPITIGLAFLVAGFETAWLRSGDDRWLRLTKFYGKLFLINFAMGVVTGIVQEFQFGMNWSAYSRFVGDIFGAPLAIEALLAFFLESTFLGLWIFGWDRLPRRVHAACIWIVAVGTMLSAYFILAANSWMQHPVGYHYNPATHREELTSFVAVLTNPTQLVTFPHTIAGCFLVAGALVAAVALWHLIRRPAGADAASQSAATAFRSAAKVGAITVLVAAVFTALTGDIQGKIMTQYQPMKMAAAEALYHTAKPGVVLAVHHRQPERLQGSLRDQDARSAVLPGDRELRRQGAGHRQHPGAVRADLRARLVHPDHPGDVLELPAHDRHRHAVRADRARSRCGCCGAAAGRATPPAST